MKNWKKIAGLAMIALLMAAVGVYSSDDVDYINGTVIPEILYGSHYFSPDVKSASFTVDQDDNFYIITSAGGAITATLPSPLTMPAGKCWGALLKTAGNAVTFSAAPYSINGAVSTNVMDAVGDSYIICNTGDATAGYQFLARYIQ